MRAPRWVTAGCMPVVAGVFVVVLAGCGGESDPPSADSLTRPENPSESVTSSLPGSSGISSDEAAAHDVLTGDFDALVQPAPAELDGVFRFELHNVGKSEDSYTVTVEAVADAEAAVDPATVTLAAGTSTVLGVSVTAGSPDDVELVVTSVGLAGEELVRVPATWRG